MTMFLANWPFLGQIGQFNPNDPKWLKSGWNLIFYVFPWCPNPITSLSFTIATFVALIDPWRVWLDPWGLRFQAWAPALLFLLFFAELVHCSGIGCQLGSGSRNLYHLRQLCVCACGTSRIQLFNWRYSQHLRQSCKTRMIHVFTPQIWDSNSPQNSKSSIFNCFRTKTTPQIGRKNPQFARKNPQTGGNQDFCPDVLWQNVFYRSKARFKWQILLI